MKFTQILLTAVIAAASAVGAVKYYAPQGVQTATPVEKKETVYERVMRTGKLRCGYAIVPPKMMKDFNTGEFSGIFYDYVEALGKTLSLDIEWVEETGYGDFPDGLDFERFDSFCSVTWVNGPRARLVDYVEPVTYQPVVVVARVGDNRFNGNRELLNSPDVKFSVVEGTAMTLQVTDTFPKARLFELPQLSAMGQMLVDIQAGKADVSVVPIQTYADFERNNPGALKVIEGIPPMQMSSEAITVKAGEYKLQRMLSLATRELLESGKIDNIVRKYNTGMKNLYIPKASYRERY